ncbi:acetate--CoA ligase family protein [Azospirillum sp. RWY-5-1]|uniref:Acetate--CoA ligase family protein n=1 Tax=Azospirillum oleiclasticum TaxID=2735135 RepID=A0ABX2T9A0_9PROT|nr:acetate--CoA ligase family protein [Azospirillum oleiclasticum]NYZ13924.1 acetate--CoA ligase family protein [Azospirillum oleiclasticum]NYZ20848.1 acetate--CoA ligase family protein [Azospirillum oleiclasticum]
MRNIDAMLNPRSIAIVGASSDGRKLNGRSLRFLLEKGYAGAIHPVNPKYDTVAGLPCHPDLEAIPGPVDLVIVAVPAREVATTLESAGRKGIPAAIVFSSGFGEMGEDGRRLEREVAETARRRGIRLCGPNTLGLINAFERVIATFSQYANGDTPAGPVGFVTQSGAFGTAIAALARRRGLGLGYFVNTGNEADVDVVEVMRAVVADPRIRVLAGYIEGLKDGPGFQRLAEEAMAAGKPVVLTKVGRTGAGARAAASHTGSLAGVDAVFDGAVRAGGMIRARNEEHMLDIVEAFTGLDALPAGRGLGLVTQSGGAGVLMADRAEELGLTVPVLAPETQAALAKVVPGFGATGNPVDVTAQFLADPDVLRESVVLVLEDPQVHMGIIWLQLMEAHVDVLVGLFEEIRARTSKPFLVCWVAATDEALTKCRERNIPVFRGGEPAVDAAAAVIGYAESRRRLAADRPQRIALAPPPVTLPERAGLVPTLEAARLLGDAGVPLTAARFARDPDEAVAAAQELGFPVAVKIESPDIAHKTEVGGVRLGLADGAAVRDAVTAVMKSARAHRPDARIEGVVVQAMAQGDVELVIGLKHDPVFGPVVMAGFGGVLVEVLKDVAVRPAPVTRVEALGMLDELRGKALLAGVRGRPPVDREAVARLICAASAFAAGAGPRLTEVDLNPVLAGPAGVVAVDWLMVLD